MSPKESPKSPKSPKRKKDRKKVMPYWRLKHKSKSKSVLHAKKPWVKLKLKASVKKRSKSQKAPQKKLRLFISSSKSKRPFKQKSPKRFGKVRISR